MKVFDHKNIVKLLGVCTKGEPAYAVMELMIHGNCIFVSDINSLPHVISPYFYEPSFFQDTFLNIHCLLRR